MLTFAVQNLNKSNTKKIKIMEKTLNALVDATQTLEYIVLDVNIKFKHQISSLIEIMQEDKGYVAFDENKCNLTDFIDNTTNEVSLIWGVKIVDKCIMLNTDFWELDNEDKWFNPLVYGDYDIHCLFESLKQMLATE